MISRALENRSLFLAHVLAVFPCPEPATFPCSKNTLLSFCLDSLRRSMLATDRKRSLPRVRAEQPRRYFAMALVLEKREPNGQDHRLRLGFRIGFRTGVPI